MKRSIKAKIHREFLKKEDEEPLSFNMKYYYNARRYVVKRNEIKATHLEFLMWGYDLEFFTIQHAVDEFHRFALDVEIKIIYVLLKQGWLVKVFDTKTQGRDYVDRMLESDSPRFSRMRYGLSNKARRLIKEMEKISNTGVTFRGKDILKYE